MSTKIPEKSGEIFIILREGNDADANNISLKTSSLIGKLKNQILLGCKINFVINNVFAFLRNRLF